MNLLLQLSSIKAQSALTISGSKSETNRLLLLKALYPNLSLENSSNSDDAMAMKEALSNTNTIIDIHHAGTAMRFLTAYFAIQENQEIVLTGSSRMKERPIKILVDALNHLGAKITYQEKEGFPPIRIKGVKLNLNRVTLPANISSQYSTALMLIASSLEQGLEIQLEGTITSLPYIKMTLALLQTIGIEATFNENKININNLKSDSIKQTVVVESDWSSASYFYSLIALSEMDTEITLSSYKKNSLQGDAVLVSIFKKLGIETTFGNHTITIKKTAEPIESHLVLNLNDAPDIAQTIAVCCFGMRMSCHLTGLQTLKIKETDRLNALQIELTKLGATIEVTEDSLRLSSSTNILSNISISTYQDHRMAMAFAPLSLKVPIVIKQSEVVSKSYPAFWEDLKQIGIQIEEIL
ncbi:3-phosphoshikimate 1-carboxyvinyltransferase [Flavobacterium sp. SUN046]|uniref:3-phosphoshikimate 1-carboxyvinyltransferase n=1 Tax=Flavobacterium sp. SUN046 TaxID=3002440 RepID=UPI002DB8EFA1|nr:3-phosphoshikimate 1-carboxyvinyltransferase [Flavobacterium sp. SUN046]MEC4049233.1 3-phosphoshikimate 1-carboxyvinyltransferase [Flavobacterium sp. SUN046]